MNRYRRSTANREYGKPALEECVIYLQFTPDEFDVTSLSTLMSTKLPSPLTRASLLGESSPKTEMLSLNRAGALGAKVRLENKERTYTVQYGPGLLTLHASQPYSGFSAFLAQSLPTIESLASLHEGFRPTELSLAYLDTFDLDDEQPVQLFKLFNYGFHLPHLPFQGDMVVREFEVSTQFELQQRQRVLSLDLEGGSHGISLFSACEARGTTLPDLSLLKDWLTESHEILVDLFESVITDQARELMKVLDA